MSETATNLPKTTDAFLTIVGQGLYGIERFEAEAKRMGIQRALTFPMLRGMEFGDPILLAVHEKETQKDEATGQVTETNRAVVFGIAALSGISYNLPEDVLIELGNKLHIVEVVPPSGPQQRICGQYESAGGYVVTDKLSDIVGFIEDICKEKKLDPRHFKYFVRGEFYKLKTNIVLFNQKFFRGFKNVSLPDLPVPEEMPRPTVEFIYDYKRRKYLKKEDKEALGIRD